MNWVASGVKMSVILALIHTKGVDPDE